MNTNVKCELFKELDGLSGVATVDSKEFNFSTVVEGGICYLKTDYRQVDFYAPYFDFDFYLRGIEDKDTAVAFMLNDTVNRWRTFEVIPEGKTEFERFI